VAEVVARRVDGWAEVLRGVRALFSASDAVMRDEFRRLAQQLKLPQRHPGFLRGLDQMLAQAQDAAA
jgi:CHASE1-domain containing sensor protein